MPFIKVFTNQSKAQLGDKFMPTVCEKLGQVLNKDLKWFNWILETDKQMSKVKKIQKLNFGTIKWRFWNSV